MLQGRSAWRAIAILSTVLVLQGCGSSGEDDTSDETTYDVDLIGSVGDGPVVNANLEVRARTGEVLANAISSQNAGYNIVLKTKGRYYPLVIEGRGGTDLVTNRPLDLVLSSASTEPRKGAVANLNPFTTLAVTTAKEMSGGLSSTNIAAALQATVRELNSGLTSLSTNPMTTAIDNSNLAEIVKASETLAEILRRTHAVLLTTTPSSSVDYVVEALASDLTDGALDGNGGAKTRRHVSAVAIVVAAQVMLEAARNELRVGGQVVTPALDNVVSRLSSGSATELTDAQIVTAQMIEQAQTGVAAAIAIADSAGLQTVELSLDSLSAGMAPAAARQVLSAGAATAMDPAIARIGTGAQADTETVLSVANGAPPPPPPNTPPAISGTPPTSGQVGTMYTFTPTASDPNNDPLTFSIANRPAWATFTASTGQLQGTPTAAGTFASVTINVSDGTATTSLPAFTITVAAAPPPPPPPNSPPVISGSPPTSGQVGTMYSYTPTASDPNNDPLTFSIVNRPAWATTFSTTTGLLQGTPTAAGTFSNITISVSDGTATASLPAFTITVAAAPNSPPVISGSPPTSGQVGTLYTFTPTASDPNNNPLTFSIVNRPAWATFTASTGRLQGTPTAAGTFASITISVSDGTATASLPAFTITVAAAPNSPPVISGSPPTSVLQNSLYTFTPTASDPNNNPLTFSIANRPAWATFTASTGLLEGTPTAANVGTYTNITISVSDGTATASLPAFTITVVAVGTGSATLTWTAPTQNVDGSPLTDLTSYRIYWGTSSGNYTNNVTVTNPGLTTYVVGNLLSGTTYYFATAAGNSQGTYSAYSNEAVKSIP